MKHPQAAKGPHPSRRGLIAGVGGALFAAAAPAVHANPQPGGMSERIPFFGRNQAGIVTPQQTHSYFVALDLVAKSRDEVVALLQAWTKAAARLTAGELARPDGNGTEDEAGDGGSALSLGPSRLTITFGFGAGLFSKDGIDRYGLDRHRPEQLVQMPRFNGDQLEPGRTGGDLSIQACADDPTVAFHAVRELIRLSYETAQVRWVQTGFLSSANPQETPRNLMGFKDGTNNPQAGGGPRPDVPKGIDDIVWAGDEGPQWMRGGSYAVVRRIRISLEHWDRTEVDFQEQVIGRHKLSGAPIGKTTEFEPLDLDRADKDGNPIIAETAHVRLGAAEPNAGAQMFRRGYSYNDGVTFLAERWPPWHQGMMYDSGLFFVAYQRDPRASFIRVFETMSKLDALNQFTTHIGGGLFACPPGAREGGFIGDALFAA